MITRRLREDNPGKTFTFSNLSVGGTAWSDVSAQTAAITAFAPDLIFVNYGVNNPGNDYSFYIEPFLAMLAGLAKVPDCIFITNKVSNAAAGYPYNLNDLLLAAAANTRTIAQCNGNTFNITNQPNIGLIDIGRYFAMGVLGYDPCTQFMTSSSAGGTTVSGTAAFPYTLPRCEGDFDLSVTFPGMGSAFQAAGTLIEIDVPNILRFQTTNGSTFYATYYNSDAQNLVAQTQNWVSGDVSIHVSAKGGQLYVVNNTTVIAFDVLVPRAAGPFTPVVNLLAPPAAPVMTINSYAYGTMQRTTPILDAASAYGALGGPISGNGINHNSSKALAAIDWAVLQNTNFCGFEAP